MVAKTCLMLSVLFTLSLGGEQPPYYSNPISLRPKNTGAAFPPYPQCDISIPDEGEITIEETEEGGWSCIVKNGINKKMAVRVQMELNKDDPNVDQTVEYYYIVNPMSNTLVMSGKGSDTATCRLCGAEAFVPIGGSSDRGKIEVLEGNNNKFSCRRRCTVTLYQHRNWNGMAVTLSSNMADLEATGLIKNNQAQISSLRIDGYGCEVRLWDGKYYKGANGGKDPICTFVNTIPDPAGGRSSMAWDMDAVRAGCTKCSSGTGQDCIRSAAIREHTKSAPNTYCAASGFGLPGPVKTCTDCEKAAKDVNTIASTTTEKAEALARLFKSMAAVLEE